MKRRTLKVLGIAVVLVFVVAGVAAAASAPVRHDLRSAAETVQLVHSDQATPDGLATADVYEPAKLTPDPSATEGDQVGPNDQLDNVDNGDAAQLDNGDQNDQVGPNDQIDNGDQNNQDEQIDNVGQNDQGDATPAASADQGGQNDQGAQGQDAGNGGGNQQN